MNDNGDSKTPVSKLVSEQNPDSTPETEGLARGPLERPSKEIVFKVVSTGKWKYLVMANYALMYILIAGVLGNALDWWRFDIEPAVVATFTGATIGATIPLYLHFSINPKPSKDA